MKVHINREVNKRLRQVREKLKLTQRQFGAGIGVGRDVIANLENLRSWARVRLLNKVCEVYDVEPEWLYRGVGNMFLSQQELYFRGLAKDYALTDRDRETILGYLRLPPERREQLNDLLDTLCLLRPRDYDPDGTLPGGIPEPFPPRDEDEEEEGLEP